MNKDRIYANDDSGSGPFRFDDAVAAVFPDMLRRSIPGYEATLEAIGSLAARYVRPGTRCYDLGCSLGAATLALRQGIRAPGCRIVAVDNAPAMIRRCNEVVAADDAAMPGRTPVDVQLGDIRGLSIANASMVVMNYTLQFVEPDDRESLLRHIHDGLVPGGLLLLSEKVVDKNPQMEALLVELHAEHKRRNAYSDLEISRKRAALENVLVPETVAAHRRRLDTAGFAHAVVWLRFFNFVSLVAIRET
jgi:tRNA (cmo5U34)-methyltransferase